jgi:CDP-glycerol glycerophosphotransferase
MTKIYKNSFWYDGEIVEWGSPRNDVLINGTEEMGRKVKNMFRIPENKKIILYAPTFRQDHSLEAYALNKDIVINACNRRFFGEHVLLIRLHPNIAHKSRSFEYDGISVFDASSYPDMQELLAATDVLISDYSSLMFDFALTGKVCFQFAMDIQSYKDDRDFYFDLTNLPFSLAKDNEELSSKILNIDLNEYENKLNEFFENVGMVRDALASKKCSDWIINATKRH